MDICFYDDAADQFVVTQAAVTDTDPRFHDGAVRFNEADVLVVFDAEGARLKALTQWAHGNLEENLVGFSANDVLLSYPIHGAQGVDAYVNEDCDPDERITLTPAP